MDIGLSLKLTRGGGGAGGGAEIVTRPVISTANDPVEAGDVLNLTTLPVFGGDVVSTGYFWQSNGVDGLADTPNFTTPNNTTPADWRVRAWATDSEGKTTNAYSNTLTNKFAPVMTVAPEIVDLASSPVADLKIGRTYKLDTGVYSGVPDPSVSAARWYMDDVLVYTGPEYTVAEVPGGSLRAEETISNGVAPDLVQTSSSKSVTYGSFTITDPGMISGTDQVDGSTLIHSEPTFSYPQGVTYTRAWRRDGVDIAGETGASYVKTSDDYGASIDVEVSATNPGTGSSTANTNDITIEPDPNTGYPPELLSDIPDRALTVSGGDTIIPLDGFFDRGDPEGAYSIKVGTGIPPVLEQGWGPVSLNEGETYDASQHLISGDAPITYSLGGIGAVFVDGVFEPGVFDVGDTAIDPDTGIITGGAIPFGPGTVVLGAANTAGNDTADFTMTIAGGVPVGDIIAETGDNPGEIKFTSTSNLVVETGPNPGTIQVRTV